MYSVEALERGIESAKKNIVVFEEAIQKERDQIAEYYKMIDHLKEKERKEKDIKAIEESINADPSRLLH